MPSSFCCIEQEWHKDNPYQKCSIKSSVLSKDNFTLLFSLFKMKFLFEELLSFLLMEILLSIFLGIFTVFSWLNLKFVDISKIFLLVGLKHPP